MWMVMWGAAAEMQIDYLAAAVFLTSVWLACHPLKWVPSLLQVQCLSLCLLPGANRHCTNLLSWTQNTVPFLSLLSNKYRKQMVAPHCFSWAPQLEPRWRVVMAAVPDWIRLMVMSVGPDICNFHIFFKRVAYWAQCFAAYLHIKVDETTLLVFLPFSNSFLDAFLLELIKLVQDNVFQMKLQHWLVSRNYNIHCLLYRFFAYTSYHLDDFWPQMCTELSAVIAWYVSHFDALRLSILWSIWNFFFSLPRCIILHLSYVK